MKSTRRIFILLLLTILSSYVLAQGNGGNNGGGNNNNDDEEDTPAPRPTPSRQTSAVQQSTPRQSPTRPAPQPTRPPPRQPEEEEEEPPEKEEEDEEEERPTNNRPPPSRTTGNTRPTLTGGEDEEVERPTNSRSTNAVITATGDSSDDDLAIPTNAPTLTRVIPLYPPPSVPPTKNAPFMQKTSMPEGTVFIAVGSLLGAASLCIFAWRAMIAWSLHRSDRRQQGSGPLMMDSKSNMQPPASRGGLYSAHVGSTVSLNPMNTRKVSTAGGPGVAGRNITPNTSLFFSPTAANQNQGGDRRSAFLPAGYYPSAGPQNPSQTHFPSHSISSSHYGSRPGLGPSPPGSPMLGPSGHTSMQPPPSRGGGGSIYNMPSGLKAMESHASLTLPPTGRAPSAYLEDLFEDHTQQSRK